MVPAHQRPSIRLTNSFGSRSRLAAVMTITTGCEAICASRSKVG